MRPFAFCILLTAVIAACGGDHKPLPVEQDFIPRNFYDDYYPTFEPPITEQIPHYLMVELQYLGWDTKSPVYHKWDQSGNLVISLSPSIYVGRYGPLQRTIPQEFNGGERDTELVKLLHTLQTWGDSSRTAN